MKKVVVIGGCNLDIIGTCNSLALMHDSNIGKVEYNFGGVAFNICQNISRILSEVAFISAIGDDYYSHKVLQELKNQGVNVEHILHVFNHNMSIYNAVLDCNGELLIGINDMSILEKLDLDYLIKFKDFISSFPIIFFDPNLSIKTIEYLSSLENIKIVDGVSVSKVMKLKSILSKIDVLKVNQYEAEALTNITINSEIDIIESGQFLINSGVKHVIISLGKNGLYYQSRNESGFCCLDPFDIVNVNGAGDGLVAGLIYGFSHNLPFKETIIYGMCISYLNLRTQKTLNPTLNLDTLSSTYIKIKEELKWKTSINI